MNSYERIMGVMEGRDVDRIPVAPIVREWCARQVGFNFSDLLSTPGQQAFAQYYCAHTFELDILWDLWGIQAEAEAMGSSIHIPPDMEGVPSVTDPVIKDYEKDFLKIKQPNHTRDGKIPLIIEGIRRLKELANGRIPVLAYVQGPFRMACMLRGPEKIMDDCRNGNKHLDKLLELCTHTLMVTGAAAVQAGADILWIGEPTSSADKISKELLNQYVLPYLEKLVHALKSHKIRIMMHVCGDTNDRIEEFVSTGIDALSVSERVDLERARKVVGDDFCLWGNVAPALLASGTPAEVEAAARAAILKGMGGNGNFVLSSGCRTPPEAPPPNIMAMVKAAKTF